MPQAVRDLVLDWRSKQSRAVTLSTAADAIASTTREQQQQEQHVCTDESLACVQSYTIGSSGMSILSGPSDQSDGMRSK